MEIKDNTFVIVPAKAVKNYGLTGNELIVYSILDNLSKHGERWTRCSLSYLLLWTSLKRESRIKKMIDNFQLRGLLCVELRKEDNNQVVYYRTNNL